MSPIVSVPDYVPFYFYLWHFWLWLSPSASLYVLYMVISPFILQFIISSLCLIGAGPCWQIHHFMHCAISVLEPMIIQFAHHSAISLDLSFRRRYPFIDRVEHSTAPTLAYRDAKSCKRLLWQSQSLWWPQPHSLTNTTLYVPFWMPRLMNVIFEYISIKTGGGQDQHLDRPWMRKQNPCRLSELHPMEYAQIEMANANIDIFYISSCFDILYDPLWHTFLQIISHYVYSVRSTASPLSISKVGMYWRARFWALGKSSSNAFAAV